MNDRVREINDQYMWGPVSWVDNLRDVGPDGTVSCFGPNITDARIVRQSGAHVPFLRTDNRNERVATTTAPNVHMVEEDGSPITLQEFLESIEERAAYRGVKTIDAKISPDQPVVFRVQNAWVRLEGGRPCNVVPAHYSYQTYDDKDPRNLIVLATPQGIGCHPDGVGIKRLMGHTIGPDGGVNEHWFKAAESDVAVGAAAQPGGSDRDVQPVQIGIRGMEPRTNCFLVVSIPLEQAPRSGRHQLVLQCDDYNEFDDDVPPVYRSLHSGDTAGRSRAATMSMDAGVSGQVKKLDDSKLVRDESEPIVVTILCFNTVVAPDRVVYQEAEASVTNEDLASAIEDIERIYALGDTQCKLSQLPSMLHPTF